MFCVNCGTQLPDDAKFCAKCGKPQQRVDQAVISSAQPQHQLFAETCEITYELATPGFFFIPKAYRLLAYAVGPNGRYKVFHDGPKFLLPMSLDISLDGARDYGEDALNHLIQALTRDGWQPLSSGPRWYQQRFHRQWDPARYEREQARELLLRLEEGGIRLTATSSGEIEVHSGKLKRETMAEVSRLKQPLVDLLREQAPRREAELRREEKARAITARLLRILATFAALITAVMLISHGAQPCGWLDNRLGRPSGCLFTLDRARYEYVAFLPSGETLLTDEKLWDTRNGQLLRTIGREALWVWSLSGDGRILATSGGRASVKLWDVGSGRELHTLEHTSRLRSTDTSDLSVRSVTLSPDGQIVATLDSEGSLRLWNGATGQQGLTMSMEGKVTGVAFSPDGKFLAIVGYDEVKLWDVASRQQLHALKGGPLIAFSPDGRVLATARSGSGVIQMWNVATGQEAHTIPDQGQPVSSIVFSPDGEILAIGSRYETVKLWGVASGRELRTVGEYRGRVDNLTDLEALVSRPIQSLMPVRWVEHLVFSPDAQLLATAGDDVKLWRVK